MILSSMAAGTGSHAAWDRLSDGGDWVVVLFGLLLWFACIFSLFCLGVRAMFTRRYKQTKHKRYLGHSGGPRNLPTRRGSW